MADAAGGFLLENLKRLLLYELNLTENVQKEIEELRAKLATLKGMLKDALVSKKMKEDSVRGIRKVLYDMEDMIGTREALLHNKESYFLRGLHRRNTMGLMEERFIMSLIEQLKSEIGQYDSTAGELTSGKDDLKRKIPLRHDNVVGLEDELGTLIGHIVEREPSDSLLDVISITGMPGIGKTTMAWRIFNDPRIQFEFPIRIWVDVSQDLNMRDVCLTILRNFIGEESLSSKLDEELISMVSDHLQGGGRFLIILDDVWTSEAWNQVKQVLPMKNVRGKVLITTSYDNVAHQANRRRKPHKLRFLKPEESWELLQLEVFGTINDYPAALEGVGKVIASLCQGLPPAIIVIGGILIHRFAAEGSSMLAIKREWEKVAERVSTHIFTGGGAATADIISWSYASLPYNLKDCFLYLGMFPEDTEIPVWKLIRLWIAEGFVSEEAGKSSEEIANDRLRELVDRNLLMVDKVNIYGEVKSCRVNNVIREFCKNKADTLKEFQEIKLSRVGDFEPPISHLEFYHRLCIHSSVSVFLQEKRKLTRARSFLSFSKQTRTLDRKETSKFLEAFGLIRVLDTDTIRFARFPSKITRLIHLRYITLSGDLVVLPEAISMLWNLQTLLVSTSSHILEIKASIWKMINLRHLKTKSSILLEKSTGEGGDNLQTLSKLSPQSFTNIVTHKAKNLTQLGIRGRLSGSMHFEKLDCLKKLILKHDAFPKENSEDPLLSIPEPTRFPPRLRILVLSGTNLDWMHMSTLGRLKFLEVLKLKDNAFTGSIWDSTSCGFESLEAFSIDQTNLKYWTGSTYTFKKLRTLEFKNCKQLLQIPVDLEQTLEKLSMYHVTKYAVSYAREIENTRAAKGGSKLQFHHAEMMTT